LLAASISPHSAPTTLASPGGAVRIKNSWALAATPCGGSQMTAEVHFDLLGQC
jgi:hypothetical protein